MTNLDENDKFLKMCNDFLDSPGSCFGTTPWVSRTRVVKEGDHYVLKEVIIGPKGLLNEQPWNKVNDETDDGDPE